MHRFRTSASPIKGLTSDILVRPSVSEHVHFSSFPTAQIKTAEAAYDRPTVYERFAPGQIRGFDDMLILA